MGDLRENFSSSEFKCPCCGKIDMLDTLLDGLQKVRYAYRRGIKINSGYRCVAHNADVGGSSNSSHLNGSAVDVAVSNSQQRFSLIKEAIYAGFTRIGVGATFIHLDVDTTKPQQVCWIYG